MWMRGRMRCWRSGARDTGGGISIWARRWKCSGSGVSGDGATALEKRAGGVSAVAAEAGVCAVVPAVGARGADGRYDAGRVGSAGAGGRADGALVDDFRFVARERFLHVLNVPSPAATASLPIGREILKMVPAEITWVARRGSYHKGKSSPKSPKEGHKRTFQVSGVW
jgi:hypothetical protein